MVDINTDSFFPNVSLTIVDGQGRPAKVDGPPVWASSDATVLTVTPSADGLAAVVETVAPGTARITVTADADLGEGVATLTGVSEDVVVTLGPSSQASTMSLSLGEPADKTA